MLCPQCRGFGRTFKLKTGKLSWRVCLHCYSGVVRTPATNDPAFPEPYQTKVVVVKSRGFVGPSFEYDQKVVEFENRQRARSLRDKEKSEISQQSSKENKKAPTNA